jgi:hypothetical protein
MLGSLSKMIASGSPQSEFGYEQRQLTGMGRIDDPRQSQTDWGHLLFHTFAGSRASLSSSRLRT